ncbi:hypothetical protein B0H14DRAFT_2751625 [Mycena olivaceomarginata]|nr:hypothetical protein B0H14DRAFT_2751625 [Mycena olivaceomarginata]
MVQAMILSASTMVLLCTSLRWRRRRNTKVMVMSKSLATPTIQADVMNESSTVMLVTTRLNMNKDRRRNAIIQMRTGMYNLLESI